MILFKKDYFIISFLLIFFQFSAQNFELKNIGNQTVWYSLGDKSHEPMNFPFLELNSGNTIKKNVNMEDYPELILTHERPEIASVVYYYSVDPYKVSRQDLSNKKIYLNVQVAKDPSNKIFPLVEAQKNINNNIKWNPDLKLKEYAKNELISSAAYYKPLDFQPVFKDPENIEKSAYNVIAQATNRALNPPNAQSTASVVLNLPNNATKQSIDVQFNSIKAKIAYLQNQPDMIDIYKKSMEILTDARNDMYKNLENASQDKAYKTLGLSKDASVEDIKKQYRKLALEWHPDHCMEKKSITVEECTEKFKEIGNAYEFLKLKLNF